jgi:hypothetical protein
MSKADEYARLSAAASRECPVPFRIKGDFQREDLKRLVAECTPDGDLQIYANTSLNFTRLRKKEALALADWILENWGEPVKKQVRKD